MPKLLDDADTLMLLESKKGSLNSVRSGVRSWHGFAIHVLGYLPEASIPPVSGRHVMSWLQVFRNAETAYNYQNYLGLFCRVGQMSTTWRTESLSTFIRGLKKRRLMHGTVPSTVKLLLTSAYVEMLVRFSDATQLQVVSVMVLIIWHFLLRVQSEGLGMQAGAVQDGLAKLCQRSEVDGVKFVYAQYL